MTISITNTTFLSNITSTVSTIVIIITLTIICFITSTATIFNTLTATKTITATTTITINIPINTDASMVENTDASWVEIKMFAPIQFWTAALLAHTVAILGREKKLFLHVGSSCFHGNPLSNVIICFKFFQIFFLPALTPECCILK